MGNSLDINKMFILHTQPHASVSLGKDQEYFYFSDCRTVNISCARPESFGSTLSKGKSTSNGWTRGISFSRPKRPLNAGTIRICLIL